MKYDEKFQFSVIKDLVSCLKKIEESSLREKLSNGM